MKSYGLIKKINPFLSDVYCYGWEIYAKTEAIRVHADERGRREILSNTNTYPRKSLISWGMSHFCSDNPTF